MCLIIIHLHCKNNTTIKWIELIQNYNMQSKLLFITDISDINKSNYLLIFE